MIVRKILNIKELRWDLKMRNQNAINWHTLWFFLFNDFSMHVSRIIDLIKKYQFDNCILLFRYVTLDMLRMPSSPSSLPWCILIPSGTYTTHDWGCVILSHIITHIVFSHIMIHNNLFLLCRSCVFKYLRKLRLSYNQT